MKKMFSVISCCITLFSVATTKYLRLGTLQRALLVHSSGSRGPTGSASGEGSLGWITTWGECRKGNGACIKGQADEVGLVATHLGSHENFVNPSQRQHPQWPNHLLGPTSYGFHCLSYCHTRHQASSTRILGGHTQTRSKPQQSLRKCKSKPHWDTTSYPLGWL